MAPDEPEQRPEQGPDEESDGTEPPRGPRSLAGFFIVVIAVVVLVVVMGSKSFASPSKKLTPGEFLRKVDQKLVRTVTVEGNRVEGEFHDGGPDARFYCTLPPGLLVEGRRSFKDASGAVREGTLWEWLDTRVEELSYRENNKLLAEFFLQLAPWLLLFAFVYFFFFRRLANSGQSSGSGVLAFGRSRARLVNEERVRVTFEDVAGIEEAKEEVSELVDFLREPQKYQRLGARIPRGVLLVGPPGTGKTLLAKAIAGEAECAFFSISGSDFVEMFVGVGASRVRDLFKQAKERAPSIIFLDEIDAVGRRRGTGLGGGHDEREQTLNAILVEMDGFHTDTGVIVLASTNRPDVLDPALSRPGRFDREITIDLPDVRGREAILRVHARKVKLAADVDLASLARGTPTYSGADLEAVINEAALLAVQHDKDAVDQEELEESRDKVRWGREKKSRVQVEEDRWTTAVHEAGHAVVAALEKDADELHKVSIIPRGRALGVTMSLPDRDRYNMPRKRLLAHLRVLFGGRVAEELLCNDIDGGAESDIARATKLARAMVCRWGMSEALGPINYSPNDDTVFLGREITRQQTMSEETARMVDAEVRRVIQTAYAEVTETLSGQRDAVEAIARHLMEHEVLSGAEIAAVMRGEDIGRARAEAAAAAAAAAQARREAASTPPEDEAADAADGPTDRDLEKGGEFAF